MNFYDTTIAVNSGNSVSNERRGLNEELFKFLACEKNVRIKY